MYSKDHKEKIPSKLPWNHQEWSHVYSCQKALDLVDVVYQCIVQAECTK